MRVSDFDYDLPRELIAQHPAARRDASRLLVLRRDSGAIEHRRFSEIANCLDADDLLVLNDTRVIPARLVGRRATGGRIEVLLIAPEGDVWRAMLKGSGRVKLGEALSLEDGALTCTFYGRLPDGQVHLRFPLGANELLAALERVGRAPLPPYIKRPTESDPDRAGDIERYQTVYARQPGAVAAPTAGLHFTPEVFAALDARGVRRTALTLHVGLGTFKPVAADRIEDHVMHAERFELPTEAADAVAETQAAGRRVVAVGTTATRVLESVARAPQGEMGSGLQNLISSEQQAEGEKSNFKDLTLKLTRQPQWGPMAGSTDLFITPGFEFRVTDALITNFHLPRSTLLMLVAAFAGRERVLAAYEEAKRLGYCFYSYGDAMLIL